MTTTSSDYQNLYALLGDQNPTIEPQPETQQSLYDRIKSSERLLFSDDNSHYIPEVEGFLELLSKRFDISRFKTNVMDKPIINSVDLLGIGDMSSSSMPPTSPDADPVATSNTASYTASNIAAPLIVSDASALKDIRDELRRTREEVSRAHSAQPIIINNTTPCMPFVPLYTPSTNVVITGTNSSNSNCENPAKRRKVEDTKEKDDKKSDDSLFRIIAFLGGLAVAGTGLYFMAQEAGEEVNEEEIDEACEKMSKVLTRLSDLNNLLSDTTLYNNLVQVKDSWQAYRKRVKTYKSEQSLNKTMIWGPVAGLAVLAAVTPTLVGQASLIGLGAVFGWGALNYIYTRSFYQSTGEKKDAASANEIKTIVTKL